MRAPWRSEDVVELVEPLVPGLRRYARALLRHEDDADDLVQDVLERILARWTQRRGREPRAWAFSILHNLAIDRMRQARRRGVHLTVDDAPAAALARPPEQAAAVGRADLLRALDDLPEEQRSVILLVSVEDLSYAEAAEVLNVPIGTVMSRLSRGRQRLHVLLEGAQAPSSIPHLRRIK